METSNLLDAEFKTLVIKVLSELRRRIDELRTLTALKKRHGNHFKMSETKDTLTESKNDLQVINSRVHEAENQNSYLEYKEAKTCSIRTAKRRKNKKKLGASGTTSSTPTFALWGDRRRRERARN